ncbi:hypothetical protein K435DRAFT_799731 [Dendrothele bispora CBS 962.96]|uniref:Uncharacterized protein n=1 Tax=Dendrothele bispora (strain CBS 962.96) TaxID=1314807 RepID=A0A4S8LW60_DENBC|nr:hypothetical protein K435DRAFT_799731 [Dendrothele bispora CBS 962.96]
MDMEEGQGSGCKQQLGAKVLLVSPEQQQVQGKEARPYTGSKIASRPAHFAEAAQLSPDKQNKVQKTKPKTWKNKGSDEEKRSSPKSKSIESKKDRRKVKKRKRNWKRERKQKKKDGGGVVIGGRGRRHGVGLEQDKRQQKQEQERLVEKEVDEEVEKGEEKEICKGSWRERQRVGWIGIRRERQKGRGVGVDVGPRVEVEKRAGIKIKRRVVAMAMAVVEVVEKKKQEEEKEVVLGQGSTRALLWDCFLEQPRPGFWVELRSNTLLSLTFSLAPTTFNPVPVPHKPPSCHNISDLLPQSIHLNHESGFLKVSGLGYRAVVCGVTDRAEVVRSVVPDVAHYGD